MSRAKFISHTARRHLAALGFPLRGDVESRDGTSLVTTGSPLPPNPKAVPATFDVEWLTEANVQAAVVTALAARGYRILSVANTATRDTAST